MDLIPQPPQLEFHVTDRCNLSCESCSDFSQFPIGHTRSLAQIRDQNRLWSSRLRPQRVNILGGEPWLHPDLADIVADTAERWSQSRVSVVTNGLLLLTKPWVLAQIKQHAVTIEVTQHFQGPRWQKIADAVARCRDQGISVDTPPWWPTWRRLYRVEQARLLPLGQGDQEAGWQHCVGEGRCYRLEADKIYKCPIVAYLPLVAEIHDLDQSWKPVLDYQPLDISATDQEIRDFFAKEAEPCCGTCPSRAQQMIKIWPFRPKTHLQGKALG